MRSTAARLSFMPASVFEAVARREPSLAQAAAFAPPTAVTAAFASAAVAPFVGVCVCVAVAVAGVWRHCAVWSKGHLLGAARPGNVRRRAC